MMNSKVNNNRASSLVKCVNIHNETSMSIYMGVYVIQ
jgi:hypothetical protein